MFIYFVKLKNKNYRILYLCKLSFEIEQHLIMKLNYDHVYINVIVTGLCVISCALYIHTLYTTL